MKISFSLRAFVVYFLILGSLLWFTLDNAIERLNDGMRQSAESVMVDIAHLLASQIEVELNQRSQANRMLSKSSTETDKETDNVDTVSTRKIASLFSSIKQRTLSAKIYQITKTHIDTDIYITDAEGTVIYDSTGRATGDDYSQWRDVRLTLRGEYGARTSFLEKDKTEPNDEKIMVVAAPLMHRDDIVGVVSVVKSIKSLEGYLLTESAQLKRYGLILLVVALLIGYIISIWFTKSLEKIANYANTMSTGKPAVAPNFMDSRFRQLARSLTHMRKQLDGKEYVENYIHSLTHELKTPITSIRGAVELLDEDMELKDRQKFLANIDTSNRRMARLVDKMLSLAKLEGLNELVDTEEFDFQPTLGRLLLEREPLIKAKNIKVATSPDQALLLYGDKLLLIQAISNLLDNALHFCSKDSEVRIDFNVDSPEYRVSLRNQGSKIPPYALDKIFDRFFSLPRTNEPQDHIDDLKKSTGLGLSFVKQIMELHNGTVGVTNTDEGVCANLCWPRQNG